MSGNPTNATGGCQCGHVRYRVTGGFGKLVICHCRMCQRATGGAFAPLVGAEGVEWEGETPSRFASSDVADRGFCAACGTPLFYDGKSGQGLHLMAGTLDDPGALSPDFHYGVESEVPWVAALPNLERRETAPNGYTGTMPGTLTTYQHPGGRSARKEER